MFIPTFEIDFPVNVHEFYVLNSNIKMESQFGA